MEVKEVKAWLSRAWKIDKEIDALLEAKRLEYQRCVATTAMFDGEVVSSTKNPHKFDRLAELEAKINRRVDALYMIKAEILNAITAVDNPTYRTLLIERYINFKTWEKIAVDMNYSYVHLVHTLHPCALKALKTLNSI